MHYVLGEIIQGGLVLETNGNEIAACGMSLSSPLAPSLPLCLTYVLGNTARGEKTILIGVVQASNRNRKASAASANPLIPSALGGSGSTGGRAFGRGGSSDGPRKWLAAMGV